MKNACQGIVRVGWLIDGSGGPVYKGGVIEIRGGMIHAVKPAGSSEELPVEMLDLSAYTVLPALIDSHAHLFMSGTSDPSSRRNQLDAGFDQIQPVIEKHIRQQIASGVVAVRDGGDKDGHVLRYKTEYFPAKHPHFDLKVAGKAWHKTGRYGRLIGRAPEMHQSLADAIVNDQSLIDHIKIVNSGLNSLVKFGHQTAGQFDLDELSKAVKVAKQRGLSVMVHANGKIPVATAIAAGCDSIEHGFFMGPQNIHALARKKISWIPTAFTMKAFADYLDKMQQWGDVAARNLEHQLEQIRIARSAGVRIVVGTDAGSLGVHHGIGLMAEMKMLMAAGLSLEETVSCATYNGARLLGMSDSGLLSKGMAATFIAVRGDPSELPDSLSAVEHVYVRGCRVDLKGLDVS